MEKNVESDRLLIVQCDCGDKNADLIACARFSIQGELQQVKGCHTGNVSVVLIVQLPRIAGNNFTGFQVRVCYKKAIVQTFLYIRYKGSYQQISSW